MSREFYYYPAEKKEDGFYPLLFEKDEDGFSPVSCLWHNADRTPDDLREIIESNRIDVSLLKGEFRDYFSLDERDNFSTMFVYDLSKADIDRFSGSGLVQGYLPIEMVLEAKRDECELSEYLYDVIPAEIYADLPSSKQNEYMKVSFINWMSKERIMGKLQDVLWNLSTWSKDVHVLVDFSY